MINIQEYLLSKKNNRKDIDIKEIKDFFNSMLVKSSSDILNDTIDAFYEKYHCFFDDLIEFINECVNNGFEYSKWPGHGPRRYTEETKTIELSVFRNDILSVMFINILENKCIDCAFRRNNLQVFKAVPDDDLFGYFDDDDLGALESEVVFDSNENSKNDFYKTLVNNI